MSETNHAIPVSLPSVPRESWRFTYSFSNSELIEYLRNIRKGTFEAITYMLIREIYLQASDRGMIKLPEGVIRGDCHLVTFDQITILNDSINQDV